MDLSKVDFFKGCQVADSLLPLTTVIYNKSTLHLEHPMDLGEAIKEEKLILPHSFGGNKIQLHGSGSEEEKNIQNMINIYPYTIEEAPKKTPISPSGFIYYQIIELYAPPTEELFTSLTGLMATRKITLTYCWYPQLDQAGDLPELEKPNLKRRRSNSDSDSDEEPSTRPRRESEEREDFSPVTDSSESDGSDTSSEGTDDDQSDILEDYQDSPEEELDLEEVLEDSQEVGFCWDEFAAEEVISARSDDSSIPSLETCSGYSEVPSPTLSPYSPTTSPVSPPTPPHGWRNNSSYLSDGTTDIESEEEEEMELLTNENNIRILGTLPTELEGLQFE